MTYTPILQPVGTSNRWQSIEELVQLHVEKLPGGTYGEIARAKGAHVGKLSRGAHMGKLPRGAHMGRLLRGEQGGRADGFIVQG